PAGPAWGSVRSVGGDAAEAPAMPAREFGHRHQLHVGHAEGDQVVEPLDDPRERPRWREGADVELVDDAGGQGRRLPAGVGPREGAVIDDPRRPGDARGLPGRPRVAKGRPPVDAKPEGGNGAPPAPRWSPTSPSAAPTEPAPGPPLPESWGSLGPRAPPRPLGRAAPRPGTWPSLSSPSPPS